MDMHIKDLSANLQMKPEGLREKARETTAQVVAQHRDKPIHTQQTSGIRLEANESGVSTISEEAVSTLAPHYEKQPGVTRMLEALREYVNEKLGASTQAARAQAQTADSGGQGRALQSGHSEEPLQIRPNGELDQAGGLIGRDRNRADSPPHVWLDRRDQDTEKVAREFQDEARRRPQIAAG